MTLIMLVLALRLRAFVLPDTRIRLPLPAVNTEETAKLGATRRMHHHHFRAPQI